MLSLLRKGCDNVSCTKDMLSVLMDSIKDADILIWYTHNAMDNGMGEWANWFLNHAKARMNTLEDDYEYVMRVIDVENKIRQGDDIAFALKEHIDHQIHSLHCKMDKL